MPRLARDKGRARRPPARPGRGPEGGPRAHPRRPWRWGGTRSVTSYTLGEVRLASGDEEGTAEAYRAVLALDPENPDAHLELGILHERRGEAGGGRGALRRGAEGGPRQPARPLLLREPLLRGRRPGDGRGAPSARRRRRRRATLPALSALASIRARRGEYGDALDYIERAVEAGESDADHFKSALEFAPLHADPRFRTLLTRMAHAGATARARVPIVDHSPSACSSSSRRRHPLLRRLRPPARRQGPARRHRPHLRTRHPRHRRYKNAPDRPRQPNRRPVPAAGLAARRVPRASYSLPQEEYCLSSGQRPAWI